MVCKTTTKPLSSGELKYALRVCVQWRVRRMIRRVQQVSTKNMRAYTRLFLRMFARRESLTERAMFDLIIVILLKFWFFNGVEGVFFTEF